MIKINNYHRYNSHVPNRREIIHQMQKHLLYVNNFTLNRQDIHRFILKHLNVIIKLSVVYCRVICDLISSLVTVLSGKRAAYVKLPDKPTDFQAHDQHVSF